MRKIITIFLAVFLVFTFASFAAAQESDPMEGVQVYDGDFKWVPGALPWAMFIPHYDIGGDWWTGLVIHNMSINANQYCVYLCDNNGYGVIIHMPGIRWKNRNSTIDDPMKSQCFLTESIRRIHSNRI